MMLTLIPLVLILLLYPRYVRKSPSYFWKRNQRRTVYVPCCRPLFSWFDIASVVGWLNCTHFSRVDTNDTNRSNSSLVYYTTTTSTASTFSKLQIIHPHLEKSKESHAVNLTTASVHTYVPPTLPSQRPSLQMRQSSLTTVLSETPKGAINKTPKGTINKIPKKAINETSKEFLNKTSKEVINKTSEEAVNLSPKGPKEAANKISKDAINKTPNRVINKTLEEATNTIPKGRTHICELINQFENV